MTLTSDRKPVLAFLAGLLCIWACSLLVVHLPRFADAPVLAVAVSLDLTVTTVVLYLLTVVRRGVASWGTAIPVFLVGMAAARLVLPAGHRGALGVLEVLAAACELATVAFVVVRSRTAMADFRTRRLAGDTWFEAAEHALRLVLRNPLVAKVMALELGAVRYGVLGWFEAADDDPRAYTSHVEVGWGGLLGGFVLLILAESVGVHLLVARYSDVAAWLLTATSLYSVLWLFGDYHLLRLEPTLVTGDVVRVRIGLRWRVDVPRDAIVAVRRVHDVEKDVQQHPSALNARVAGEPSVVLDVDRPIEAHGPFGIRRTFTRLALSVDDPDRFVAALR